MAFESEDCHQFPPHLLASWLGRAQSKAVAQRQACVAVTDQKVKNTEIATIETLFEFPQHAWISIYLLQTEKSIMFRLSRSIHYLKGCFTWNSLYGHLGSMCPTAVHTRGKDSEGAALECRDKSPCFLTLESWPQLFVGWPPDHTVVLLLAGSYK